jgi:hypothetical protein
MVVILGEKPHSHHCPPNPGNSKDGLNTRHLDEFHGRMVLDFLNQLWKVQWIGVGGSYFWGSNFSGRSVGADVAFRF